MKHLIACSVLCMTISAGAQVSNDNYDPDSDGDNSIGVNDLLSLLSLFGETDVDNDGIWDSNDDCLADSCSPKAYLFIEPQYFQGAIGTYMYYSGYNWFGLSNNGGAILNASDAEAYFGFLDEVAGVDTTLWVDGNGNGQSEDSEFFQFSLPSILSVDIPQTSNGVDEFGNPQTKFLFNTFEIPQGSVEGDFWFSILINEEFISDDEFLYITSEIGLGPLPSVCSELTLSSSMSSFPIYLESNNFGSGVYRCFGIGANYANYNVDGESLYIKGLGFVLE